MDWQKWAWKIAKTGLVAAGMAVVADPSLTPAILEVVPTSYRMMAALAIPMGLTALRNWLKHSQPTP